jgi:hypothetical protein
VLDASARALAGDGLVVLEHATRREPDPSTLLEPVRHVKSGDSTLTFFVAPSFRRAGPLGRRRQRSDMSRPPTGRIAVFPDRSTR